MARPAPVRRNAPLNKTITHTKKPDPRLISRKLMARDTFKPAGIVNTIIAAAWIQFENHNWFFHGHGEPDKVIDIPLRPGDDFPVNPMQIRRTIPMNGGEIHDGEPAPPFAKSPRPIGGTARRSTAPARTSSPRCGRRRQDQGRRQRPSVQERQYPVSTSPVSKRTGGPASGSCTPCSPASTTPSRRSEEGLPEFRRPAALRDRCAGGLALIAKIHTVEWTPCILRHPAPQIGMNANWYGALGETFRTRSAASATARPSGIVGSPTDHHTAPFSLTEEFVTVYRLHRPDPGRLELLLLESGEHLYNKTFTEIQGKYTRDFMDSLQMGDLWYSMGMASAGAVCLHNYPNALRKLERLDGQVTDLATLDIVRDRERGVPRYNDFREMLRMPRRKSIDEITPNKEGQGDQRGSQRRRRSRGCADRHAGEQPPKGFGFSDTAFRIFILMASRRLKSDRFFTRDFNADAYTQVGFDWVNKTSMKDVILRHYPELEPVIGDTERVFAPWRSWALAPASRTALSSWQTPFARTYPGADQL